MLHMDCRMYNQCWMWNFGSLNVECPISPWKSMLKFQLLSNSNLWNFGLCLTDFWLQNVLVHEHWTMIMVWRMYKQSINTECWSLNWFAECLIIPGMLNVEFWITDCRLQNGLVHECWIWIAECTTNPWILNVEYGMVCKISDKSMNVECGTLDCRMY